MDFIHHIRADLKLSQLERIICCYAKYLHDSSFAPNIQTMCVKLLLNLVDCILKLNTALKGRELLFRILQAFTSKLVSLDRIFPVICKYHHKKVAAATSLHQSGGPQRQDDFTQIPEYQGFLDLGFCQPIKTAQNQLDSNDSFVKGLSRLTR